MASTPLNAARKRFHVTIAGQTTLDLVFHGLPEELIAGHELAASGYQLVLGGHSSILAHNLAILGSKVGFFTLLGRDEFGTIALQRLEKAGVDLSRVVLHDHLSTGVAVVLPHGSLRHVLTYTGASGMLAAADLDLDYLADSHHFHLSSHFLEAGPPPEAAQLLAGLKSRGLTVSLDTCDGTEDPWCGCVSQVLDQVDVLMPNEDGIKRIANRSSLEQALDALAGRIPNIVVKCGTRGVAVQRGPARTWIDPVPVSAIDTIGAGDSFNAGFLHAFAQGHDAVASARLGMVASAMSALRPGGTDALYAPAVQAQDLR